MRSSRTACSASCGFSIVFLCIRKRNGVCFVYYYWGSLRLCVNWRRFFAESEDRTTLLFLLDFAAVVAWRGPTFFFFVRFTPTSFINLRLLTPAPPTPILLSAPPPHTPRTMAAAAAFDLLDKFIPGASDSLTIVNATTAQNTLYPGVDFAALNWLERLWASYYIWVGNPIIATGLMSFVLHEVCWRSRIGQ